MVALHAAFLLSDPGESFRFRIEPGPGDKPRIEKVVAALQDEQRAFFQRLRARVRAIAQGLEDSAMLPAIGVFHCGECSATYEFDRRGMLRAALAARGQPYGVEPPAELRDTLDVVVWGLAEELPNYACGLTFERLSYLYKLKLETDGFGNVIASGADGLAGDEDGHVR